MKMRFLIKNDEGQYFSCHLERDSWPIGWNATEATIFATYEDAFSVVKKNGWKSYWIHEIVLHGT